MDKHDNLTKPQRRRAWGPFYHKVTLKNNGYKRSNARFLPNIDIDQLLKRKD
jgi:hypothetical protein